MAHTVRFHVGKEAQTDVIVRGFDSAGTELYSVSWFLGRHSDAMPVPEPGTGTLLGTGALLLLARFAGAGRSSRG